MVLTRKGELFSFGHGSMGQLGLNGTNMEIDPQKARADVQALHPAGCTALALCRAGTPIPRLIHGRLTGAALSTDPTAPQRQVRADRRGLSPYSCAHDERAPLLVGQRQVRPDGQSRHVVDAAVGEYVPAPHRWQEPPPETMYDPASHSTHAERPSDAHPVGQGRHMVRLAARSLPGSEGTIAQ